MTSLAPYGPRLQSAASALGLEIGDEQAKTLLAYLEQLQRWNRTYNLTALRDPEQMLIQHLFDSLSIVLPLTEHLKADPGHPVVADVGSGAGLPGVVVAIMCPDVSVHCVDTVEKKATFIRYVAGVLRLQNLKAHHARIESLPPFEADIVVSRAFASLLDFATLAGRHVGPEGRLLAMKGQVPHEEIAELHSSTPWRTERVETLQVPEMGAQRCLVWLTEQGIV